MTTIKAYTTIEQSKKLAEFLPLDTADQCFLNDGTAIKAEINSYSVAMKLWKEHYIEIIPCWSLTALLEFLRNRHDCNYVTLTSNKASLWCLRASYYNHVWEDAEEVSEDAVDACVKMIIKLNELKML